ncbi:putative UDP-arabinose 4-epimerase 3 [Tetrabaena socialis]|uniref:Putative UDP-arabinose 4-epimerase 3 n=1 Tax=Tetrabaena socialis TaxID=47790 RepID=A0A2J8AC45_9CHLO|nr:putative UDP-arabinose 4-epimerase 3 [Tetrabaena socialis]|eukprot:PNH10094.1 putative UDP-arabinose 4-epimerase 3 [Tetrabaena socialis]
MSDRWHRDPLRYLAFAAIVSTVVYYVHFSGPSPTAPYEIPDFNPRELLQPEPGAMHIVVTGGAGYIGSHAAMVLAGQGHAITSRISGACMDAALGLVDSLTVKGTKHPTEDGTCVRDYVHVMDLVSAHVTGVRHLANPPPLFNIGTGKGVSVKQFVDACRKVTGREIKVVMQEEARPGDYAAVWSEVGKIKRELGWSANYTDVEEGLRHAWRWREAHPNGY